MVLKLLHKANLCFLLNRLVGRSVLANAECVVCPYKLNRYAHKGSHTDGRLHIVGKYEEGTASRDNTTVQIHTDADASHRQLGNTSLEESAREVVCLEVVCVLEEAVGLVAVAEVG